MVTEKSDVELGLTMDLETKAFYDEYWPKHVPNFEETRKYMMSTISERQLSHALDAGCGHGLCSIFLSEIAERVTATDVSSDSLDLARFEADKHGKKNIDFLHEDLQHCSLPDETFDLVWCWGVAMMAPEPMTVIEHLMRVTKPGGVLYLGVYLKTWLSPLHQIIRHFCRAFMNGPRRKRLVCAFFARLTRVVCFLRGEEINLRSDNWTIQSQVEDWYYPPFKSFFSIDEIADLLSRHGFESTCIQDRVGRMKSATIFVTKGIKTAKQKSSPEQSHDQKL